jgi:hypothetical protein
MSYYERKAQKEREVIPLLWTLAVVAVVIILMAIIYRYASVIVADENAQRYNHQRVTEQQIAAIANEAKSRGWKYIRTEDGR